MRQIGGEFHLPVSCFFKKRLNQFNRFIPNSPGFLTSSGRDSLRLIIRVLNLTERDEVLLPSYLCGDILIPFEEEGVNFSFYKVNKDLRVDISDIEGRITKKTKAIMAIHYFGYPQRIEELRRLCEEQSLCLIEDTVQSFLSKYNGEFLGSVGDLAFTSFRKYLPVLDGSLVLINAEGINSNNLKWANPSLTHALYLCLRYLGMSSKNLHLKAHIVPEPLFLWLFAMADKALNKYPKPAKMSHSSTRLLCRLDFGDVITRRRANFQYLLDNWHFDMIQPLFHELPADVCPLGFPVLASDRDYVKQELVKRGVYPPIHWNLPSDIDKEEFKTSWEISREILTIPVDQRYEPKDMDYILWQIEGIEGKS